MNLSLIKNIVAIGLLGAATLGAAKAETFTESFDEPFTTWEARWFGVQSNATNYCDGSNGCSDRGGTLDGPWLNIDGGGWATPRSP